MDLPHYFFLPIFVAIIFYGIGLTCFTLFDRRVKLYRWWKGGTWYLHRDRSCLGPEWDREFWSRTPHIPTTIIIKTERYG